MRKLNPKNFSFFIVCERATEMDNEKKFCFQVQNDRYHCMLFKDVSEKKEGWYVNKQCL
jgi:beta-lactamase superfamily II metal-dependent hydrolase